MLVVLAALLIASQGAGQSPANLVRNADFERAFVPDGPADGWSAVRTPQGGQSRVARGEGLQGGSSHRLSVPADAEVTWYLVTQTIVGLRPGDQGVASVYVRTRGVRDGAGAYFGMNYYDSRGERIAWTDSADKVQGTRGWRRLTQPFTVPPNTERVVLALVLHGRGTVYFDRAQVERGKVATAWAPREAPADATPGTRPAGRGSIALFRDSIPPTGTASQPEYLRRLAEQQGYRCAFLNADALANPRRLNRARFDLLILPYGSSFPAAAADNLRAFLRDGGSLLTVGGYPFDRLLARQQGQWKDVATLAPDERGLTPLLDPGRNPRGWGIGGRDQLNTPAAVVMGPDGPCLTFGSERLPAGGWVTLQSPPLSGLPAGARALAFYARGSEEGLPITFEVVEKDGSRWRSQIELSRKWRLHAVALADLAYWHDNPSQGRGGTGDRLRPEHAASIRFGITTEFVRPDRPYRVEVGRLAAGADPFPAFRNVQLNSRYGKVNPATFLVPPIDALSICDASAPLSGVAYLAPAPEQTLLSPRWRLNGAVRGVSATGQTAQGEAGAPLKARWVPLVEARDRYGRVRGTAFALMHHFAGEYPGSSWGYSGIANRDLFAPGSAAGAQLFRAALERLVGGAFLFDARAARASVRPGEPVAPMVRAANRASRARALSVRLTILAGGKVLSRQTRRAWVPAHSAQAVTFRFQAPARLAASLLRLRFELLEASRVSDRLEAGTVLHSEQRMAAGPPLRYQNCYFSRGRGPEFLVGTQIYWGNQTVTGADPLRWARQFRQMADNGIRVARSFTAVPGGDTEAGWRYRDALVQLAQGAGVALFYAGVSWPSLDPAEVSRQARIATQAAARYQAAPGWFLDIVNEPSLPIADSEVGSARFRAYLQEKYGSFEALREAWQEDLTESSLEAVKLAPMAGDWQSVRAVDVQRFMAATMRAWATETMQAAKRGNPRCLVSLGHLQGFGWQAAAWDPIESSYDLDFTNRHFYGNLHDYGPELAQIDQRTLGKAPSTGEFGATSHPGLKAHPVYEPEADAVWRYTYTAHTCFGLGGAFVLNWHWQDPIEDIFPCGLLLADGAPRDRFFPYRNVGALLRCIRPRYQPAPVYFVIPTAHRYGMSKAAVESAMARSLRALIALHVDFGTIAEETLHTLPPTAKALVWPLPFCPDDATYAAVRDFVRRGGALYVSGDLSYDPLRRRTRTERLEELCGVRLVAERYPNLRLPEHGARVTPATSEPLGAAAAAAGPSRPCVAVHPTTARVLARAGDLPAAVLNTLGAGTVLYVTDPLELHTEPRALLAAFLSAVGIARHGVSPDQAEIHSHRVPGEGGAIAQVLLNLSREEQRVTVSDLPQPLVLTLAPRSGGAALFDGRGTLVAAEGKAMTARGRQLFSGDAPAIVIALDGRDLRAARSRAVLPLGPGTLRLPGAAGLWAEVGEVRGGQWVPYERRPLREGTLRMDAAMARAWILVAPQAALRDLARRVPQELL